MSKRSQQPRGRKRRVPEATPASEIEKRLRNDPPRKRRPKPPRYPRRGR